MPAKGQRMPDEQRRKIGAAQTHTELPREKHCPKCRETKPADQFRTRKPGGLVLASYCKPCEIVKQRENPPRRSANFIPCRIEDCPERSQAKKLCWKHYNRLRTYGDPLPPPARYASTAEALAARTNRSGPLPEERPELGRCWIWTGSTNGTYGRVGKQYTHRLAYEIAKGPISAGLQIDHLCRNVLCVNPEHLEAVTGRVNLLRSRGFAARQAAQIECVHGHPLSGSNLYVDARGRRHCRACRKRRGKESAARKRAARQPGHATYLRNGQPLQETQT